jgi:hypothetical protein
MHRLRPIDLQDAGLVLEQLADESRRLVPELACPAPPV